MNGMLPSGNVRKAIGNGYIMIFLMRNGNIPLLCRRLPQRMEIEQRKKDSGCWKIDL